MQLSAQGHALGLPFRLKKRGEFLEDGIHVHGLAGEVSRVDDLREAIDHRRGPMDLRLEHVEAPDHVWGRIGYALPQEGDTDDHGVQGILDVVRHF